MSEPIGPGDWVECIDATPSPNAVFYADVLVLGALYYVRKIHDKANGRSGVVTGPFYELVGIEIFAPDGSPGSFAYNRFRPIRDGQERIVKKERVSA